MSEHGLSVCSYFMLAVTLSCSNGFEIREKLAWYHSVSLECFVVVCLFVFGVELGGWVGGLCLHMELPTKRH